MHFWSGDSLGYVDALSHILARCKEKAREEGRVVAQRRKAGKSRGGGDAESKNQSEETNRDDDEGKEDTEGVQDEDEEPDDVLVAAEANLSMWLERIARVCLILTSQMIEMNVGAISFCIFPCISSRLGMSDV